MFHEQLGEPADERQPCAACQKPAEAEAWGHDVCLACLGEWHRSAEMDKAQRQLNAMPLWQRVRLEEQGRPTPPWPPHEESCRVYRAATEAWLARVRRAAA